MVQVVTTLRLAGGALGAIGGVLLFLEFFQLPTYLQYDSNVGSYSIDFSPQNPKQYTWIGRVGALLIAVAFALQFLAAFLS
ncbi:MAG: hypothetical protein ABEJ35_06695 [Halobacteriaceae archaeon]